MKSGKFYIFCLSIMKSPKKITSILSIHYNNGWKNMIVIRDPKLFILIFIGLRMLMSDVDGWDWIYRKKQGIFSWE